MDRRSYGHWPVVHTPVHWLGACCPLGILSEVKRGYAVNAIVDPAFKTSREQFRRFGKLLRPGAAPGFQTQGDSP